MPLACVTWKAVHVTLPLDYWDAQFFAKVKGHMVWQCDREWRTEVAEPVKRVQQVSV